MLFLQAINLQFNRKFKMNKEYYLSQIEGYHFETVLPFLKLQSIELSKEFYESEERLKELDLRFTNLSDSEKEEYRSLYTFQCNYLTEVIDTFFEK